MNLLNAVYDKGYSDVHNNTIINCNFAVCTLKKSGWVIYNSIDFNVDYFVSKNTFNIPIFHINYIPSVDTLYSLREKNLMPLNITRLSFNTSFKHTEVLNVNTVEVNITGNKFEANINLGCQTFNFVPNASKNVSDVKFIKCENLLNLDSFKVAGLDKTNSTLTIFSCPSLTNIDNIKTKISNFKLLGNCSNFVFTDNEFDTLTIDIANFYDFLRSKNFEGLSSVYGLSTSSIKVNKKLTIQVNYISTNHSKVINKELKIIADKVGISGTEIALISSFDANNHFKYIKP